MTSRLCFVSSLPIVSTSFTNGTSRTSLSSRFALPSNSNRSSTLRMVVTPESPSIMSAVLPDTMSVLLPEKLSQEGVSLLSEKFTVVKKLDLTPEQLLKEIPAYDGIIIRSGTKMTREVIDAATNLKVIGRAGVGVDNIDIPAATERGILVVNAPTGNCVAAAEHTIALLCGMSRLLSPADSTMKNGAWNRSSYVGASLVDKTLGIVGLGRIGREVTKRAQGLGMKVIAFDPFTSEEAANTIGVQLMEFDDVLSSSDVLTLHIPLLPTTKDLIDADAIAKMKHGARIVNAARGGIVNEEALLEALDSGKIAGAALDCFTFEPPGKYPDSSSAKVVAHPSVLATPHLGASTREAQLDVAVEIATNVRDALGGDMVPTMINAPAITPQTLYTLKPRAQLCEALGRLAYFLSGGNLHGDVSVDYFIPDAQEDTRILRSGVIKGLMEPALGLKITIVNSDHVAKNHNLSLTETNHIPGSDADAEVIVHAKEQPAISGRVTNGFPHVTTIGDFELDLRLEGIIMAYSQVDRPGQLGRVGTLLGDRNVNISSMTLARCKVRAKALVLLRLDSRPPPDLVKQVEEIINDSELRPTVIEF